MLWICYGCIRSSRFGAFDTLTGCQLSKIVCLGGKEIQRCAIDSAWNGNENGSSLGLAMQKRFQLMNNENILAVAGLIIARLFMLL